jgi:GNAT superfamily N-acetyltransferase
MLVRVADTADLDELVGLRAAWRNTEVTADFVSSFGDWFRNEGSTRWWWMAVDDSGRGAGMVNVKLFERMPSPGTQGSRWGYLANLFVLPRLRTDGLGSELVIAAVDKARAEGLARLVLSPSERSRALYLRLGFRPADELLVHPLSG